MENDQKKQNRAFVEKWSRHYYRFTNISDNVFYYCVNNIRNPEINSMIVAIAGAWKENCLSLKNVHNGLQFQCPGCNTTYYSTNRWAEHCPIAFNGWQYISRNINNIIKQFDDDPGELFKELSCMTFPGYNKNKERIEKRFGAVFTSALFNVLDPGKYAIIDQFAFRALQHRNNNALDRKYPEYTFDQYQAYNEYFFSLNYADNIDARVTRSIDKALFSHGHYLKDNESINKPEKRVCNHRCMI